MKKTWLKLNRILSYHMFLNPKLSMQPNSIYFHQMDPKSKRISYSSMRIIIATLKTKRICISMTHKSNSKTILELIAVLTII